MQVHVQTAVLDSEAVRGVALGNAVRADLPLR